MKRILYFLVAVITVSCKHNVEKEETKKDYLFEELSAATTGIDFENTIVDKKDFNIFNYRNFYNGGGVAIGDINNDGLPDVFLTSNMEENKLYLNKGNLKFEDITLKSGINVKKFWSTGVTFADVNGDGFLDIYVCNSGSKDERGNQLYINNGVKNKGDIPTFTEKAKEYGLVDGGFSIHAAFFDYDQDGDLDMFLLNNSFMPVVKLQYANLREKRDKLGGQKLFRNDGNTFTDVSETAGIYGSVIGFGLGITIGDVNNDNWLDIYISNDFYERDYLYINNKNGTFTESLEEEMPHISLSSMGADIADINNDGNLDIFVTDMLPGNDFRLKTTSNFESYELFQMKLTRDFHYQYMQNMLHLNNGDGTFSEISRLAGVHATDWSWGALMFDMDNDGFKDIFVANGIAKDLTDQDFVNFLADENNMKQMLEGKKFDLNEFLDKMSSSPIPNYAFKNEGNLKFTNKAKEWGLGEDSYSNGSAYGDLDNDGDLDLIVNRVNMPVGIFKNNTTQKLKSHYLRVKLNGDKKNLNAIGAKVFVKQKDKNLYLQQMPNRGFQSSVDLTMVFGLGKNAEIEEIKVVWQDGKMQILKDLKADQEITLDHKNADLTFTSKKDIISKPFTEVTNQVKLDYTHEEKRFVDYNRDPLLKQMYSTQGPALATGDVNGDGLEDVYLGGSSGMTKKLFIQLKNGTFQENKFWVSNMSPQDTASEDVAAVFFDADNDKDLDLYVVTGSNEFETGSPELLDRFYINDGKGNFTKDIRLPNLSDNGSCVAASDFDQDGDIDLFIGNRMISGQYGYDPPSYLLINDGTGEFKNYTKRYIYQNELGMITDATWQDLDGDKYPELVVVGDWMPITIFKNEKGRQLSKKIDLEIQGSQGWWNTIKPADIDGDGDMDFIIGNLGKNSKFIAESDKPATLYVSDFDGNGTTEQVISCYTEDGKPYPMVLKSDLQKEIPELKKKFIKFEDYAGKKVEDIFDSKQLKMAVIKKVYNSNTSILVNNGNLKFNLQNLPIEAQFSPVYGIETVDYNNDGNLDILLTGNFYDVLPEIGRYDANYGLVLNGTGKGNFDVVSSKESGFFTKGQVRKMKVIKSTKGKNLIILAKNNDKLQVFSYRK